MAEKFTLGAQLYTLRNYCETPKLFEMSMDKVAEMGFKYVQFSGVCEEVDWKMMGDAAHSRGMGITLTHYDDDRIINETEAVIEEHDYMGCDGIGIGGMPREFRNYEGYMRFIEKYSPAVEKIKKAGKTFCYHNHWFEFQRFPNGKTGMEMLLENTDPEGFKLTLDTAWMHHGGVDVAQFIDKYPDRIFATHLKDITIIDDEVQPEEVLSGNMNFDSIMDACRRHGIKTHLIEQDITWRNAFTSLNQSFYNLCTRYPDLFGDNEVNEKWRPSF